MTIICKDFHMEILSVWKTTWCYGFKSYDGFNNVWSTISAKAFFFQKKIFFLYFKTLLHSRCHCWYPDRRKQYHDVHGKQAFVQLLSLAYGYRFFFHILLLLASFDLLVVFFLKHCKEAEAENSWALHF